MDEFSEIIGPLIFIIGFVAIMLWFLGSTTRNINEQVRKASAACFPYAVDHTYTQSDSSALFAVCLSADGTKVVKEVH